ncbi:MAG: hypothetical protein HFF69_05975 [Oscillospiraceae bacterium]|jgi:hypothetical protein|nr:hypothetical protein [Oscillospiraceae bacterium]
MKRHLTLALVFLSVPALMGAAQADVIAGPAVAVLCTVRFLPWILVGAVVGVTVFLLRKFWKKKK